MKRNILLYAAIWIVLCSHAQQQFIHTAAKENISCNYDCTVLDIAELNNNPDAVILVTPVSNKVAIQNAHPIGAYFFKSKWHIFNLDSKPIPEGSKFNVEYFTAQDMSHFQYSFTRADIQADGSAFIDHPLLNNNPTAKFNSFLSWNPGTQGAITNREEITVQYNPGAGKWYVSNNNNKPITARVTYNISISGPGRVNTQIVTPQTSTVIPALVVNTSNTNTVSGPVSLFVTAWADRIKIPGDKSNTKYPDRTELQDFDFSVSRNVAGRAGTKNYDPVTIKIITGVPGTIPFFEAFIKKSIMDFTFEAFTNTAAAKPELNYTIKLSGATIVSFKQISNRKESDAKAHATNIIYFDEIRIIFTKIEFIKDNVTVEDIL
jgi:hypothetical protein